jgi:hypothetical protein
VLPRSTLLQFYEGILIEVIPLCSLQLRINYSNLRLTPKARWRASRHCWQIRPGFAQTGKIALVETHHD